MHLPAITTLLLAALAAAVPSPTLSKRCRMGRNLRPCWIRWDDYNCVMYIPVGVTYEFDDAAQQVTIRGLCESCSRALAREEASAWDSNMNWATSFGAVRDLGNGTFVIKEKAEDRDGLFDLLRRLKPNPTGEGDSCVGDYDLEG